MYTKHGFLLAKKVVEQSLLIVALLFSTIMLSASQIAHAAPLAVADCPAGQFKIDVLVDPSYSNGTISPDGSPNSFVCVDAGTSPKFDIIPEHSVVKENDYIVKDVLVDGASEGRVLSYTFPPISQDHTIVASFYNPPEDIFPGETISSLPFNVTKDTTGWRSSNQQWGDPEPIIYPVNAPIGARICDSNLGGATVWYNFTPSSTEYLYLDTLGSDYNTVIAVWSGTDAGPATLVSCNDQDPNVVTATTSALTFKAIAGQKYYIEILHWPCLHPRVLWGNRSTRL